MIFKSLGTIQVKDGVRILANLDLIRYYHRLIDFYNYRTEKLQLPSHGAHITLINPKIHRVNWELARKFHGRTVEFEYDPTKIHESRVNYWIPVTCEYGEALKKVIGVRDGPNYWGLHCTVANRKFNDVPKKH